MTNGYKEAAEGIIQAHPLKERKLVGVVTNHAHYGQLVVVEFLKRNTAQKMVGLVNVASQEAFVIDPKAWARGDILVSDQPVTQHTNELLEYVAALSL